MVARRLVLLPTAALVLAVVALAASPDLAAPPQPSDPAGGAAASVSPAGNADPGTGRMPASTGAAPPEPAPQGEPGGTGPTPDPAWSRTPSANPRIVARLRDELEQLRVRLGIPGLQATILFPDGTSWTGATGVADIATGQPVVADTPFAAASISKSFTAAVILQLVAEGALSLDEPVAPRLPSLALDPRITVRQLLDHTSGLNDYLVSSAVDRALRAAPATPWTEERALSHVGKPYFLPGRGWRYSNTNYVVLGLLAETVTGDDLATLIRTHVSGPLGLASATYQGVEEPRRPLARAYRFAVGPPAGAAIEWVDGTGVVPFTAVVTATAGAGSMAATSRDIATFARAMWGGDLVPAWLRDDAIADAARVARFKGALPYGLGVQVYPVDGRFAVGHSGRFSGARGVVRYFPDEDLAIAVMTNQSRIDPAIVLSRLLAIASPPSRSGPGAFLD